ncbi:hypothetical protein DRO69_02420 [Candidatus Bathyarchaeota archaeon]|nr:MAG: hypothetical protein DRO69_02420 [Candidatus Bathyarchaeota archaeon]
MWRKFYARIDKLIKSFAEKPKEKKQPRPPKAEKEVEVTVDNKYYGKCPKCGTSFDYDASDIGRLVRCRFCNLPMRLEWKSEEVNG